MATVFNMSSDTVMHVIRTNTEQQQACVLAKRSGFITNDRGLWPPSYNTTLQKRVIIDMDGRAHFYTIPALEPAALGRARTELPQDPQAH